MRRTTILIKKYENRRLYNTNDSRYVNLEEVAVMVQEGHDVQVVDASTGEDLTRQVLTQIIADYAKTPNSAFPLDVLRQMVIATGKATHENTLQYMKALLDMYQGTFRAMTPSMNPFEFMTPTSPPGVESAPGREREAGSTRAPRKKDSSEVDELKQRVEELEALVSRVAAGKRAPRPHKPKARSGR
jgi:polyhydroxyalkanoate synthesis repressor PhaR